MVIIREKRLADFEQNFEENNFAFFNKRGNLYMKTTIPDIDNENPD